MAKKKTRVQEPKKKPWAMSIERAQVKPLRELPPGSIGKHDTPVGHIPPIRKHDTLLSELPPEALAKLKRRGPKPLSELLPGRVVKKSAKSAPARSPTLKWKIKKR